MRIPGFILSALLLAAISAGAAPRFTDVTQTAAPTLGTSQDLSRSLSSAEAAGAKNPVAIPAYELDDKYRLRPGDKLGFQILEDRVLPRSLSEEKESVKSLVVADSGEVDVPYIGRVMAKDKTCKQLGEEIKAELEKHYYYQATVVLALDVANKFLGRIYVWGQVRNQGPIEVSVNENITAGKAILRAGGFADFANKKKVKVIRAASEDGTKQNFEINMVEVLEQGKTEKDMLLQPDDFVLVPSRLINF